jgi:PAS domain-containing protein
MLAFLADSVEAARRDGFRALRVTGEMTWALGGAAGSERLMEYESKLNRLLPAADALAICQYSRRWFPAETVKEVIETHPLVIHGATVCRNPYYVPPEEFLGPRDPSREVDRLLASLVEGERSAAALRVSEAPLAEAQRVAHLGHWEWDIPAGTLVWSDEVHRIFGVERGAFGGTYRAFLQRVRPDDRSPGARRARDRGLAGQPRPPQRRGRDRLLLDDHARDRRRDGRGDASLDGLDEALRRPHRILRAGSPRRW